MSNVIPMQNDQDRRQQAAEWIAKMDRDLSSSELEQLRAWIRADQRNERELEECARLWDMLGALHSLADLMPQEKKPSSWRPAALAASLALALVAGLAVLVNDASVQPAHEPQVAEVSEVVDQAIYTTPVGDQSTIHLNDGSVVQLNTETQLQVRMTAEYRLLTLEQGEIHIDVAHDPQRPLRVLVGDKVFEALGTSFNVRIDESGEVELIVTEGRVRVELPAESFTVSEQDSGNTELAQGERIVLNEVPEVEAIADGDIEVKLAWREGMLVFRGSSLDEAVREVGRYTHLEFVVQSEDLKAMRVAGVFKAGDVEGFLASLRANFDVVDRRIDEETIALSLKPSSSVL
ncbi:MAG: FecR domain-containing protein [Pseudomonadota bacterium]|nr:FecR domain-containing protein [Pseudomonadota bacterium]